MAKINLPSLPSQLDSRWATNLLGFNTDPQFNFKNYACLICDLTAVACYYGYQGETPVTINDKLKALGPGIGFTAGSGNYVYGSISKVFKNIKERLITTPSALTDEQMGEIKSAIDKFYPVMVQLDYDPKDTDLDSHFVLLVDYNSSDENDFTIFDPLGGRLHSLKDYLGWYKPSARKTIEKYLIYEGPVPQAGGNTIAVDAAVFPNLVHGSGEWDATVAEYVPAADPKKTAFADVQRTVNGFKSDATQSKNRANELEGQLNVANTEIANQKDKVANVEAECQRALDLKLAEIKALKEAQPNIDKLVTQYTSTISGLETSLQEAKKQGGLKDLKITELETKINQLESGQKPLNALEVFIKWVKSVWGN